MNYTTDGVTIGNFTSVQDIEVGDTIQSFPIIEIKVENMNKYVLFFETGIINDKGDKAIQYSTFIDENHIQSSVPFKTIQECKKAYYFESKDTNCETVMNFIQNIGKE